MNLPYQPANHSFYHTDTLPVIKVYAFYRLALTLLLAGIFFSDIIPEMLGQEHPALFKYTITLYTVITFISLARLSGSRFSSSDQHVFLICLVDITAITLLMHSSGGVNSSLGLLLFVTISAGSITLTSQIANLLAAMATIAIITESIYRVSYLNQDLSLLVPAGLLGLLLFTTAQLFRYLTQRMQQASEEAERESIGRIQAQQLNQLIVQRMRTGILVLSPSGQVRLINQSGKVLLNISQDKVTEEGKSNFNLSEIPVLYETFSQWKASPRQKLNPIKVQQAGPELQISYASLDEQETSDIILFIEDTREMAQQAQQLKLASLGHLTASIAHEVRNPLGAISHAAQLLAESETVTPHDHRLTEIIQNHSNRVNKIIENILQLSRRNTSTPRKINLDVFLDNFVNSYKQTNLEDIHIDMVFLNDHIECNIDPSQLEQILSNLCDNGLRYSKQATGVASITLKSYIDERQGHPCLDIIDDGEGIPEESQDKVFEPFYTTDNAGTGLGLYLSRELCESNQARLDYTTDDGKSCFRISFAHAEKLQ